MKRILSLILVLALSIGILSGCGVKETTAHTYEDLTISIPTDFIDLTGDDFAEGLAFVFGLDPIAVNGLREEKATFEAYGLDLDLQGYGSFILKANKVSSKLQQNDGYLSFSYTAGDYTYIVTLWETEDAFWTVQAYCPTADYAKAEKDMWKILKSVTV